MASRRWLSERQTLFCSANEFDRRRQRVMSARSQKDQHFVRRLLYVQICRMICWHWRNVRRKFHRTFSHLRQQASHISRDMHACCLNKLAIWSRPASVQSEQANLCSVLCHKHYSEMLWRQSELHVDQPKTPRSRSINRRQFGPNVATAPFPRKSKCHGSKSWA